MRNAKRKVAATGAAKKRKPSIASRLRPPAQVWVTYIPGEGLFCCTLTQKEAKASLWEGELVAGPYVLAERVRAK